ncbi:MAG: DDE-type integrase/transposase/recombinase [Acidobacteriota bacterium]
MQAELAISDRITDDLVVDALQMAITRRRPRPGLIVHSDRGSRYASAAHLKLLEDHKFRASMSRIEIALTMPLQKASSQ